MSFDSNRFALFARLIVVLFAIGFIFQCFGFAQPSNGSVLIAPGVIVEAPQIKADASGLTVLMLNQDTPLTGLNWEALSRGVAGLNVSGSGSGSYGSLFALRGLSNTPYFSDPAVTVYFGDIPLASGFMNPTSTLGFVSSSIYRGPQQQSEFGRAGEGGVIVMNIDQSSALAGGKMIILGGSYSARSTEIEAWTGSSGTAETHISAGYTSRAGYIQNLLLGKRVDNQEESTVSSYTRWKPSQVAEFSFQLLASRIRDGAQPLVPLNGPLFKVSRVVEGVTDINSLGVSLKGVFNTFAGKLTTVTSYTDWAMDPYSNYLILPPALNSSIHQNQKTWNEELHYSLLPNNGFTGDVGAWISEAKTKEYLVRTIYTYIPYQTTSYLIDSKTMALFGKLGYTLAKGWESTAGLRIENNVKDFSRAELIPNPLLGLTSKGTYTAFLPKLELKHEIDSGTHASISVSMGAKPGGFSGFTEILNLSPFAAEHTTAYEAGIDHSINRGEFNLALRAYDYFIKNYQIERSFSVPAYIVANAPKAHSLGGELELSYHPVSAWTITGVVGITDITLTQFKDPLTGINYSGDRAPYAPAYNANLDITYHPHQGFFAGVDMSATGKTYYNEQQSSRYAQNAYMLLNAKLGYGNDRYQIFVFGSNITNEGYYALIIPGVGHGVPGAPVTVGAQFTLKY